MALEIRHLNESDSGALAELMLSSYDNGKGMWFPEKPSRKEAESVVAKKLDMLKRNILIDNVASLNGEVIGDCEIVVDGAVGLMGILVSNKHRGTGVGRALLIASLKAAVARGMASIFAEVETGNYSAISFFTRNGFSIAGNATVEKNGKSARITRMEFVLKK